MSEEVGAGPDIWNKHNKGKGWWPSRHRLISSARKAFFPREVATLLDREPSRPLGKVVMEDRNVLGKPSGENRPDVSTGKENFDGNKAKVWFAFASFWRPGIG